MDSLKRIIGPAPSEVPFEDFLTRLRGERERVLGHLQAFREKKSSPSKKGVSMTVNSVQKFLEQTGMTFTEFQHYITLDEDGRKEWWLKKLNGKGNSSTQ